MDNVQKDIEINQEIVKLNEDFGITRDAVSLVSLSGRQISLQTLNEDISSIINFLQNSEDEDIYDIELNQKLELPLECTDKLIKIETGNIEKQTIEYQLDRLNKTTGEYSIVDCIQGEMLQSDIQGASCSRNYNEHKTLYDKKLEIEEKNLLPKIESQIISNQTKTNPIKGKSLLNSNKNVVKSSTKGRSLLKINRNFIKTLDNEINTNKTICTKLKESTNQTESRKIETNKIGSTTCAEITQSSGQFKQIGTFINLLKLKYSANSNRSRATTSMKLRSCLKSNRNITRSEIDGTNLNPEIQMPIFDTTRTVSKQLKNTNHIEIRQTDTTVEDTKPTTGTELRISMNRSETLMSEITDSDVQIARYTNPVKGKSLLNSNRNVVKSSKNLRSLLKTNKSFVKISNNHIDTKKSENANRTETVESDVHNVRNTSTNKGKTLLNSDRNVVKSTEISLSHTLIDSNGINIEIQFEPADFDKTVVSKPQVSTCQNETNQSDKTIDLAPTESKLQNAINKSKTAICSTETAEADMQIARYTNPVKGKCLLNSPRNVVKSSKNLRSLLKTNRNIMQNPGNHIDTERTNTVVQSVTKMDSNPIKSEIHKETYNFDKKVVSKLFECTYQSEISKTDPSIDSERQKLETQIECEDFDTTVVSKPQESYQTGIGETEIIDIKPTESELQIAMNKYETAICTKTAETDVQIARYTNPVKGKSLLNSNRNVVKSSKNLRSLLKTNRNIMKSSGNHIDTTTSDTDRTKSVVQSVTKIDSKPIKSEIQMERYNGKTVVSKPLEGMYQFEINRTDTYIDSECQKLEIKIEPEECTKPVEVDTQEEIRKTYTTECTRPVEGDIQKETSESDTTECTKRVEVDIQKETSESDTTECTKPVEVDIQEQTRKSDTTECTKPVVGDIQKETRKSDSTECTKSVEVDIQEQTRKSDTTECTKPVVGDIQKETSKSDTTECTEPVEVDIQQKETSESDTTECTEPVEVDIQEKTSKSDTAECTEPVEVDIQEKTSKSDTTGCTEPVEVDIQQKETSESDTTECTEPVEVDIQEETSKSDTTECTEPVEVDIQQKETGESDTTECTKPVEGDMQKETSKSDTTECTEPVEVDIQEETRKSGSTECTKPVVGDIQKETSKSDTTECTEPVEVDIQQKEKSISDTTECTKPVEGDMQKETSKSDTTECTKPVEGDMQKETSKSDTTECTKPVEGDMQKETSKSDTTEYTEPVEVDIQQKDRSKSDTTECTKPVEGDMQKEASKSDTTECTEPVEVDIQQKDRSKSDTTECTKPVEGDMQKETSKSDTTECTEPVEVDIQQKDRSKSDTTECTKPVEGDMQKETSKSDTTECTEPVEVDIQQKDGSKSDTTECTKPVEGDIQKETSKSDTTECTEPVDVNKSDIAMCTEVQKETKTANDFIFKIPQVPPVRKIRKLNTNIAMSTKSNIGRNVLNCADRIIFKKPKRPVSRSNIKRKIRKYSASTKFANNQIVTDKFARIRFNHATKSKYSADIFIKRKLLKRKELNRNIATCSKKPKLTGSYSSSISTTSLERDDQKASPSKMCINDRETNEICTDDNILWSSGDDLEIVKRSTETITVDSDTDSNYSVSSIYDELVEQKLFIERPEGYPRIRVRTDLMPKSPNEEKKICGITLLYNSALGRYAYAVVNVEEFKKKYADRNLKLLLKKPNFRMDLHRVYRKIGKMISEGTYTLDELKENLIENVDKVLTAFEMYISLKKKHKEFYESELEATKELAAELEIRRRIRMNKIETIKRVADIKKKSWCSVCQKEATIHSASAKYYCSIDCQNLDSISIVAPELSLTANVAKTATKMEDRKEVSPETSDNGGQCIESSSSELKIAEVWSLNDQEEQEVIAASETGRIAVLCRRNYKNKTRKETVNKVTSRRGKPNDVVSGETMAWNVPSTSLKGRPSLNIKRVCPSSNASLLKKIRCDLKDISKLNPTNNTLNLGKVNKVACQTEGTVNVPALIIDFPKNKPSNLTTMNKSPQKLLLTNVQKQDGQLKNTPLRLCNFQTNTKGTMPTLILNNIKTQNKDSDKNAQILHIAQPKSTTQLLQKRPNNQNLVLASTFNTSDTGCNKQYNNIRINTNVNNKNIPTKSLLLCKKTDMPSTSGIHKVVMVQDLEKPGPSGLNKKSTRNTTNTVRFPTKPTISPIKSPTKPISSFIRKPTATATSRYPIKPTSVANIFTKPIPTIRSAIKPTNIITKFPRKPTMNIQPILALPTTTHPIAPLPSNYATNIRMPRPIINCSLTPFNVTRPRKILCNNKPRPMGPRFLFPKPAKTDNLKQNQIKPLPTMKPFVTMPSTISQSQCIINNNNQTRINATTAPNIIIGNTVSDIPNSILPTFSNAQSLPNVGKTLIVAKDNTYKLAVPSTRSDNTSKPVYIIRDLPQKMEF